jgi:multiple antibiotic resistance protein
MAGVELWEREFARVFLSFFAIVDPLGNVLVFYLLTRAFSRAVRLWVAGVAVLAAGAMVVLFSLAGRAVLDSLGISVPGFTVAAGLLLLLPAYRLVSEGQPMDVAGEQPADPMTVALVPLATPLIAGPGALASAISFAESQGVSVTLGALAIVLALSFVAFATADRLFELLGPALLRLLSRLVGILLFAIAVEFILRGIATYF